MSQWSQLCINRLTLRIEQGTYTLPPQHTPQLPTPSWQPWHPSFPLSQYVRVRDESAKWEGRGGGPDTNVVHWASLTDLPSSFVEP